MASRALNKVLEALPRPDTKLVRLHGPTAGFYLWPHGGKVPDEIATALLERDDIQPFDLGLPGFGFPQSWKQGNWRTWAR
jgi:hypothetical protein